MRESAPKSKKTPVRTKLPGWKKLVFSLIVLVLAITLGYNLSVMYRSYQLYRYIKSNPPGWRTPPHKPDAQLGWTPVPGIKSAQIMPIGADFPACFDADGFRVPLNQNRADRTRPLVLALGCSCTYGAACRAQDTYPYKVAKALHGSELNAGVCSYGLAQMAQLANKYIPKYSPDYVLVQYSPWLIKRAMTHFAPSYYSYNPNPFFADTDTGGVAIEPPVFLPYVADLNPWRETPAGVADFLDFFFLTGLSLYIHEDTHILGYSFGLLCNAIKSPTDRVDEVVKSVFSNIQAMCRAHNARLLVVVLGDTTEDVQIPNALHDLGITVVDAQAALVDVLPERTMQEYHKAYGHFRGVPPQLVDGHHNPLAHHLIAMAILHTIREAFPGDDAN